MINNVRATVYQPMIQKLQFEIVYKLDTVSSYCDKIFLLKIKNKLPLESYYSSGTDSSRQKWISLM